MTKEYLQRLELANKMIFVKRYSQAFDIIEQLLEDQEGAHDLLVHLRRIELAAKLEKLSSLKDEYSKKNLTLISELSIALIDQHGEFVGPSQSVDRFQQIIKKYGESAAAYYGIGLAMEAQGNTERALYNYQQSIGIDPSWFPSYFGLSQIYYSKGDEAQGNHFFYLFEQQARFNVYGNFETHKSLCTEFIEAKRFMEAEAAIETLSEWWIENRGFCPSEIQLYELFVLSKIAKEQGDITQANIRLSRAESLAQRLLKDSSLEENILYFAAKILEEFGELKLAFKFYRRIISLSAGNPAVVQKIGSHFISLGEIELAKEVFDEAYHLFPNLPEIRFCRLVTDLKMSGVNVEEYLIGRERLPHLLNSSSDRVELLSLLHSLIAKYQNDPETQGQIADVYFRLGNPDRAEAHYDRMYELDHRCRATALKYASFCLQRRQMDRAEEVLSSIDLEADDVSSDEKTEYLWLKSNYYSQQGDFKRTLINTKILLGMDPWNVGYLIQYVIALSAMTKVDGESIELDETIVELSQSREDNLNWKNFDQVTSRMTGLQCAELVYNRLKIRFLYSEGDTEKLAALVESGAGYDPHLASHELIKLLNTNFDSASIYYGLGQLAKAQWQLETGCMWLEQSLAHPNLSNEIEGKVYVELADSYLWLQKNYEKAIEYVKLAFDLGVPRKGYPLTILAHGYIKLGKLRQAEVFLDQASEDASNEAAFLKGLILYRNGQKNKANETWKALMTELSNDLRNYTLRKEILKFYYDEEPYFQPEELPQSS